MARRRTLCIHALAVCALLLALSGIRTAGAQPVTITDILGRSVTLPKAATRVALADGRQIVALSILHPDPLSLVAGWLGDFRKNDSGTYALYRAKFPQIDAIPVFGAGSDGAISVEAIIATKPDVALLGIGIVPGGDGNPLARQLEAAGIPVVFTDFFVDPFNHTVPGIRIVGQVIGREAKADEFIAFYQRHMDAIAARLAQARRDKPKILFEAHAGISGCCFAPGRGNIGRYIDFAGGHSIAADVIPGATGQLNLEYVIAQDPQIYVATGGPHLAATGGLVIGPGYDENTVRSRLVAVVNRPGIAGLRAVREKRVYALFHNLLASPLNLLATEALAKWINPDLFADLDVERTKSELNARFLAVPLDGVYWLDLK